ncbi:MAG: pirin family protein [Bacteroidetes bacterium]|nr:pirin family protein [Bacteroidota bacterium]
MEKNAIISIKPLGFMWPVGNPFLFFAHHLDHYPAGNEEMGPKDSLKGRNIGEDFTLKDGWRMYHGERIPGFPVHPHRGFETVTIVRTGFVDHADSHGQAGRYGRGDVQWMTAGAGLQHSEMFPLLNEDKENPAELFQIWLNLPKTKKFAEPHFKMLWSEDIPVYTFKDDRGKQVSVNVIAGNIAGVTALSPAPDSWAADPRNEVAIWTIRMEEGAEWRIPAAGGLVNRTLYFYEGSSLTVNGTEVSSGQAIELRGSSEAVIVNGNSAGNLVLLQGKPIPDPVVQYGPFVMNTEAEIQQAFQDFRKTSFGGWPWPTNSPVYPRDKGRFALHKDGTEEIRKNEN